MDNAPWPRFHYTGIHQILSEKKDNIAQKNVFEMSCKRVHGYCADKGKKLRGIVGPPGPKGEPGSVGVVGALNSNKIHSR
jgi:hypothetical protein